MAAQLALNTPPRKGRGLVVREFSSQLSLVFDRFARWEVTELEHLANLAHTVAGYFEEALGPFNRVFLRIRLEQREAGDQLLCLGKRAVDHGAGRSRQPDARAFRR